MEIDGTFDRENGFRTYHTVCLGPDDETNGFADNEEFFCENVKTQEDFQKYLDAVHAKNNITFYCHPQWSNTPPRYFEKLKGFVGMEVWNSGCAIEHDIDKDAAYWDEMLGQGHKLWGFAVDDGHPKYHHCNGWVMVNAEKNVKNILDAITNGDFYSSTGPVIKDFYVDGDKVFVEAEEECSMILFCADKHPPIMCRNTSQATAELNGNFEYVRAVVVDKNGRRAWTNPIFLK